MRRMGIAILVFVSTLSLGCASTGGFKAMIAEPDPFNPGAVHYVSSTIKIKDVQFLNPSFALLQINSLSNATGQTWVINTHYCGNDWLFVEQLKFVVDGLSIIHI